MYCFAWSEVKVMELRMSGPTVVLALSSNARWSVVNGWCSVFGGHVTSRNIVRSREWRMRRQLVTAVVGDANKVSCWTESGRSTTRLILYVKCGPRLTICRIQQRRIVNQCQCHWTMNDVSCWFVRPSMFVSVSAVYWRDDICTPAIRRPMSRKNRRRR